MHPEQQRQPQPGGRPTPRSQVWFGSLSDYISGNSIGIRQKDGV
jgi:hypothetical protein